MKFEPLVVRSRLNDYTVHFHTDLEFLGGIASLPHLVLVIDGQVADLYSDKIKAIFGDMPFYRLESKEDNKNLREVENIYSWVVTHFSAKKNLNFVSIGGGITQDITGFVASTLFRGVKWLFVPTTLLAQVDSCIGGKSSLNFQKSKNLLGTFYPPREVHISTAFLPTLSALDMASGHGEIIKFLLMRKFEERNTEDIGLRMESICKGQCSMLELIRECLLIKCTFMENDEFDQGRRNLLNYGHCFGHSLESTSEYYVPHGIAVNIGIIFANIVAEMRQTISTETLTHITNQINLPALTQPQRPSDYESGKLLGHLKNDKKRTGSALPLVIPVPGGLTRLDDVSEEEFLTALSKLVKLLFTKG
jgi:3-dehydroquinate synthase